MNDPNYPSQQKSNALVDYFLMLAGLTLIMAAAGLLAVYMVRQDQPQNSSAAAIDENAAYNGELILYVPAGSRTIEALQYSSQVPIVVMFDADW